MKSGMLHMPGNYILG